TIPHSHLERQRIDLLQRALVELGVNLEPILFLRVHVVVLRSRDDRMTLDALDVVSGHLPGQQRILPKSLEQTTESWDASDIQSRTKQDIVPCSPRLKAQQVAILLGCGKVPHCSQGDG